MQSNSSVRYAESLVPCQAVCEQPSACCNAPCTELCGAKCRCKACGEWKKEEPKEQPLEPTQNTRAVADEPVVEAQGSGSSAAKSVAIQGQDYGVVPANEGYAGPDQLTSPSIEKTRLSTEAWARYSRGGVIEDDCKNYDGHNDPQLMREYRQRMIGFFENELHEQDEIDRIQQARQEELDQGCELDQLDQERDQEKLEEASPIKETHKQIHNQYLDAQVHSRSRIQAMEPNTQGEASAEPDLLSLSDAQEAHAQGEAGAEPDLLSFSGDEEVVGRSPRVGTAQMQSIETAMQTTTLSDPKPIMAEDFASRYKSPVHRRRFLNIGVKVVDGSKIPTREPSPVIPPYPTIPAFGEDRATEYRSTRGLQFQEILARVSGRTHHGPISTQENHVTASEATHQVIDTAENSRRVHTPVNYNPPSTNLTSDNYPITPRAVGATYYQNNHNITTHRSPPRASNRSSFPLTPTPAPRASNNSYHPNSYAAVAARGVGRGTTRGGSNPNIPNRGQTTARRVTPSADGSDLWPGTTNRVGNSEDSEDLIDLS